MAKHACVDEIIRAIITPSLASECSRLGIPVSFVQDVSGVHPKTGEFDSICQLVDKDGCWTREVSSGVAVRIRIACDITSPILALVHFWHEMWHAKEFYERRRPASELRATMYSMRRAFFEIIPCIRVLHSCEGKGASVRWHLPVGTKRPDV